MATYTLRNATTTNNVSNSFTVGSPLDTYTAVRFYTSFDTSSITAALGDITSVKLYLKITAITGSTSYILKSADSGDTNWGATLTGDVTDFASTFANIEGSTTPSGTGWSSWDIDKNNLDLSGTTWFRLQSGSEGLQNTRTITFASQNNATAADRPYLEVISSSGVVLRLLSLTGVGI